MFDPTVVPMALIKWHTIFMTFVLAVLCLALSKHRTSRIARMDK
jgi:hypothetical protein